MLPKCMRSHRIGQPPNALATGRWPVEQGQGVNFHKFRGDTRPRQSVGGSSLAAPAPAAAAAAVAALPVIDPPY